MDKDFIKEKLGIQSAISPKMAEALQKWRNAYTNNSAWLNKDVESLEIPSSVASEIARLVTLESVIDISGSPRADFISLQLDGFREGKKNIIELAAAIGGMYFRPYVDENNIIVDYVYQDEAIPFNFDGKGNVIGVIFPFYLFKDHKRYTRMEIHSFQRNNYTINNRAFVSKEKYVSGPTLTLTSLGTEIPLSSVEEWKNIDPLVTISGVDEPFFSYMKIPIANNIDRRSPLGMSVFSRAMNEIRKADIQASRLDWEFASKETAIELDEGYLKQDIYGNIDLPKGKERLFRSYTGTGSYNGEKKLFEHFSPEIRDQSYINGLNRYLRSIEFNCGLAYGTLSDPQDVEKTAEEIKSSKQRSYQLVHDIQESLEKALRKLIKVMDNLASAYDLAPEGDVHVLFTWDDSIIVDSEKERIRDLQEIRDGVKQKYEYRVKWFGEDEETAKRMVTSESEEPGISFDFGAS